MAWKTIPHNEWEARADVDFWQPYARTRSDFSRMQRVRRQLAALRAGNVEAAKLFAQRLAFDDDGATWVRATCLSYLATLAEAAGDIDEAIDHAMLGRSLHEIVDGQQLVQLIIGHGRADRAAAAAEMFRTAPIAQNGAQETRDLQRAAMLMLAGQETTARNLANQAFDSLMGARRRTMYMPLVWASQSRGLNRLLFRLVRRGGLVRIVGLLGENSAFTPDALASKLANHVYFNQSEITPFADRVIVDLADFSLDFRWTQDALLLEQVRQRYDRFKEIDRVHIPQPPPNPKRALIMLAIGDDDSRPEVINPLIELSVLLESFGECIFYERIGPISRPRD